MGASATGRWVKGTDKARTRASIAALALVSLVAAGGYAADAPVVTKAAKADSTAASKPAAAPAPEKAPPAKPGKETVPHGKAVTSSADTLHAIEIAAEKDTGSFEKNYRLGVAYLDRDRPLDAVRVFERATRLRPKEVKAWVNLGAAYDAIGHGDQARQQYRQALNVSPEDEIALCRLGASLYAGGGELRPAAMDTLRLTIKQHPKSYCAYFTLGVAFADAQIYQEAIRCWDKVAELAPNSPEAASAKESITTLKELFKTTP